MTITKADIGKTVRRSSAEPIVDMGMVGDEASIGLQHGDHGTIINVGAYWYEVVWDRNPGVGAYSYKGDKYVEFVRYPPLKVDDAYPRVNGVWNLSKCCSCPRFNEYDNDANCDDGWRCGECRVIRSLQ